MKIELLSTQILIIGGGGAGLLAAMEARQQHTEVLLLSKTVLGGGSNTTLSFGYFRVASDAEGRERHAQETRSAGRGLNNPALVEILVNQSFDQVGALREFGVPLTHEPPYFVTQGPAPFFGRAITESLYRSAVHLGVNFLAQTMALDLIIEAGEVRGVIALNRRQGTVFIIKARAVILATGGAGAIYQWHNNSPRVTGDGYAMAMRAGAALRDMEFIQFYPVALVEGGVYRCIMPAFLVDLCPIRNTQGDDVVKKYGIKERPVAIKARDTLAQALFREIIAGRGFGASLEMDLTGLDEAVWEQNLALLQYRKILWEKYPGKNRPLPVAPVCHFFMGGLVIDQTCQTSLPGLFAAGEVTGGLHGANRLGGNALSELAVFGPIAGRAAAEWSKRSGLRGSQPTGCIPANVQDMFADRVPTAIIKARKKALAELMFKKVGIVRNMTDLTNSWHLIQEIAATAEVNDLHKDHPVWESQELTNMIDVGRQIIYSAKNRPITIGAHCLET